MEKILNFIGGELVAPAGGSFVPKPSPVTGRAYALLPDSDSADVAAAVGAARAALPAWSETSATERADVLYCLAAALEAKADEFARAESVDTGKLLTLASRMDVPRSIGMLRFYGGLLGKGDGGLPLETSSVEDPKAQNRTLYQPLGVVACITPWNLPLYLLIWKVAPALAAGNCAVAKPSEISPMTAFMFAKLCHEIGLPAGVLNVVQGLGAKVGPALVEHPDVAGISFTGSTAAGADIARRAAPSFKRLSLEMGGKNATLVFGDADFGPALDGALRAAFANQGQFCLAGSRILVEQSLYNRFRDALVEKARGLVPGDPLAPASTQGAIASQAQLDKIAKYVALARAEGGRILTGGERVVLAPPFEQGFYYAPTVIEGLSPESALNQQEIFGPVVTLAPFTSEQEAVALANGTRYGLTASVFTGDATRADRVARQLHAGTVWINCWLVRDIRVPFGGMKDSGLGREGGQYSLRFFTEPKNVCTSTVQAP
jgi:aminomuconate-semialdehyde/2-hydroxymuconate-6-semialdehyde dehydrogenase